MNKESETQSIRLRLADMAYGGDAIGRDPESGMAVFAWPGISGEEVEVAIRSREKNLLRGMVTSIYETSPARVTPPCPYFGSCGGCQWQHVTYEEQLRSKHGILRSHLMRLGGISDPDPVLLPPLPSPNDFHYRNTSHFALHPQTRSLAYYRRESRSMIPVEACPISSLGINRIMPFVNSLLKDSGAETDPSSPTFSTGKGLMSVWKITIRASDATGHAVVVFHSLAGGRAQPRGGKHSRRGHSQNKRDVASPMGDVSSSQTVSILRRSVRKAIGSLIGSALGERPPAIMAVEVMDDGTINRLGETRASGHASTEAMADMMTGASLRAPHLRPGEQEAAPLGAWIERLGNRNYWVGPEAFFQTNTGGAEVMLTEVARHMPDKVDVLVDAHAGVGTFALQFAHKARRILAFETEESSIASGQWSSQVNNTSNVEFQRGRAEELLPKLAPEIILGAIILDPPRNGCHPALLAEIVRRRIPRIIYVSCDPSTLARDLKILASTYSLASARVIDMFPQTFHIETVAVLDLSGE